jgi:hypothetical protein
MVRTFDVYEQNDNDLFHLTGLLREIDLSEVNLAELFGFLIQDKKKLEKVYLKASSDDGQLIGQEKSSIMSCYESVFQSALLLRKRLTLSLDELTTDHIASCALHAFNYDLRGVLCHNDIRPGLSHGDWLKELLHPLFQDLLEALAKGIDDNELDYEEKKFIVTKLDRFIVGTVSGFFMIRSYNSSR